MWGEAPQQVAEVQDSQSTEESMVLLFFFGDAESSSSTSIDEATTHALRLTLRWISPQSQHTQLYLAVNPMKVTKVSLARTVSQSTSLRGLAILHQAR